RTLVSHRLLHFLLISFLPQHAPLSISNPLSLSHSLQSSLWLSRTRSGLINSSRSAPQLFLALTQTATNW
ncbi:unnamed protein product, partial [Hymenolepis diminuta]